MKHKKLSKQSVFGFGTLSSTIMMLVLLSMILFSFRQTAYSQTEKEEKYKIVLKSRTIIPQVGIKPQLRDRLKAKLSRDKKLHVIVQLKRFLNIEERANFEKHGIKLLSYVGGYAWYATLTDETPLKFTHSDVVKRIPTLGSIRWIGDIKSTDRVSPDVLDTRMKKWIKTKDNRERYSIYFFKDTTIEACRQIIRKYRGEIKGDAALIRCFYVEFPGGVREKLMAEDYVKLIDLYPPPDIMDNDGSRGWTHTDIVHTAGRTGSGVILGLWEAGSGLPLNLHVDLTPGRVHWEDAAGSVHYHATHVAGTMVGTGTGNALRMGHAPGVNDVRCYTSTGAPGEMVTAINSFGIVAANCSYGKSVGWAKSGGSWVFDLSNPQSSFGDYRWDCPAYDQLVHENGLVIVFSSGNDRNDPDYGSETDTQPGDWDQIVGAGTWDGYHTSRAYGTAKNVICVGAINDATGAMSAFSNWGPTDDGRIKPDIVAPGVSIVSCRETDSNVDTIFNDYRSLNGTSMSAPAVTGIAALLIQSYREDYLGVPTSTLTPLPSTIKALLCHSAVDMGNAGPDYQFGWGGVRADDARQLILDKKFLEGVVLEIDDYDVYEFTVGAGEPEIKITLAWDDHPAAGGNPDPTIINDLDLVVEDADGSFYTPWHLHVTDHTQITDVAERQKHTVASISDIPEAHFDRWNNVEQVFIDATLVGGPLPAGTWKVYVHAHALPEPPQPYSLVVNEHRLQGQVDIMQVLDRSGSMGGLASTSSMDSKIQVLRYAADQFIYMMKPDIGNQLGLVQFNQNVVPFALALDADLSELTTARATTLRDDTVPSIDHGGRTSIGDGLTEAFNQLTGSAAVPGNDKVILLVSDGKENEPQWISGIQADLISNNIAVYPLGLGYGSGIDETKLTDLAEATGGSFRITSDPLIFRKFFIEILAGAVNWSVLTDPIVELGENESTTHPVAVTGDQSSVTFTTYWEGIDNAVYFEIIPPSGEAKKITPQIAAGKRRIRCGEHPRYTFYQIDFPLSGNLVGEWAGEWKMKLTGTNQIPANQKVRCSMSAFAERGAELEVNFDKLYHLTGDSVLVNAKLSNKGKPITGATIDVYCNVPTVGAGNILHEGKVSLDQLKKPGDTNGDIISPVDRKLQILAEQAGKDILERGSDSIELYDDGQHGDGKANDGIYANSFTATRVPGSYTFRFAASFTPTGSNLLVTREWTKSFYNEVNIDARHSVVDARLSHLAAADKILFCYYDVKVAPRDKFGNYLGPGRPVTLTVVYPNGHKQSHTLDDNIDGTYTKKIRISQADVKAGAKLVIDVSGKTFTSVEKLPSHLKWSVSLHSGATFPTGSFGSAYNSSYMLGFDFDYHFTTQFSFIGFLGYNRFKASSTLWDDTYLWNLSANLKYELTTSPFRPYVNAGAGFYKPKGGSIKPGVNVGLGWDYSLNPNWILELGGDYHHVFTSGSSTRFFVTHAGLIYRF